MPRNLDAAAIERVNPGRSPAVHRLNRAEYTNAVRDLLAVEIDGRELLPADDASYGFDNIGDVLTVSQPLLERYLSAAQRISRLAIGDPDIGAGESIYPASRNFRQDDRMGEELPFGTRGGISVRHTFPVDAEYGIRIELQRAIMSGRLKGLGDRAVDLTAEHRIDVRLDGKLVTSFTVGPADIVGGIDRRGGLQATQQLGTELSVRVPVQGRNARGGGDVSQAERCCRRSAAAAADPQLQPQRRLQRPPGHQRRHHRRAVRRHRGGGGAQPPADFWLPSGGRE